MKVNELFESSYTPPVKNPKLRFSTKAKIPVGGTKEWLKAFGATETDIQQALRVVRQGASYRAVKALDMKDESTARHDKLGSIMFIGAYKEATTNPPSQGKFRSGRWKMTLQANGKIDETAANDWHRAPVATGKPHIVPGDAVGSIVKTMNNALDKMAANLTNRRKKEAKEMEAVSKSRS